MRGDVTNGTFVLTERGAAAECGGFGLTAAVAETDYYTASTLKLSKLEVQQPAPSGPYEPFKNRADTSVTDAGAMTHLLKGSLGTGILAMPNAFRHGGLAFGMVGTLLAGLLCTHCVHILVRSSQKLCHWTRSPALDYAETARAAFETGPGPLRRFAPYARWFVNAALCATYYSAGAVYIVFIAQSVKQIGDFYSTSSATILDVRVYIVIFMSPLCLICLIRNLKYLVPFSAVSNVFIAISFCITLSYLFTDLPALTERKSIGAPIQMPLFFSTVIFAMEGIGVVMPIENTMKHPGHFLGCPGILNISMGIVIGLYAIIGFFGYVKYGEDTLGSVTLNLPVEETLAQVVKILYAAAIFFTFGLQMYVPCQIMWGGLKSHVSKSWQNAAQNCFRVTIVIIAACVAIAVPNLGPIISLVGAVCFSTLGLLCPAVIETVAFWDDARWRRYKNGVIMLLALCALFAGAYTSILEIIGANF